MNRISTWDAKTAKDCKIPEVYPELCERCRDLKYCNTNKLNLRQMTIEDLKLNDAPFLVGHSSSNF